MNTSEALITWSYCEDCGKMRRFKVNCWGTGTKGLGPALVPVTHGSEATLYTPETALGWVVDARCMRAGHCKRMVVPREWAKGHMREGA